jgi:PAS domain S-box-containing protein
MLTEMNDQIHILLIEDSEDDELLLRRELVKGGLSSYIKRIENEREMIAALDTESWDVIISDYRIPGFRGDEALRIARDKVPDIPFIVFSGVIGEDLAVDMLKAGASDYVMKHNLKRLVPAIRKELEEMEIRREKKRIEKSLIEYQNLYQKINDLIPVAIVIFDIRKRKFIFANKTISDMLGYSPMEFQEMGHETLAEVVHPNDHSRLDAYIQGIGKIKDNEILDVGFRMKDIKGNWHWLHTWDVVFTRDHDGKPAQVLAAIQDVTYRKNAEEDLLESEAKWRSLVQNAPDIITLTNREGEILFINYGTLGYKPSQIIGRTLFEFFDPQSHDQIKKALNMVFEKKYPVEYETMARKDNEVIWYGNRAGALTYQGEIIGAIIFSHDISEHKQLIKELNEQKEILQAILDHAPIMTSYYGSDLQRRWINKGAEMILGWPCNDYFQEPDLFEKIFPDTDYREQVYQYIQEADGKWRDYKARKSNGSAIDTSWVNVRLSDGAIIRIGIDITQHKNAERALMAEKERVKKYIDVASVIMVALDTSGKVTMINRKGCEVIGLPEEEILGKDWFDNFLPHNVRESVKVVFEKIISGDLKPVEYNENPVLTAKGHECLVAWHNAYIEDEEGALTGTLSSGTVMR